MTTFLIIAVPSLLAYAIGMLQGYDKGVRETLALERLRAAFPLRPMRYR